MPLRPVLMEDPTEEGRGPFDSECRQDIADGEQFAKTCGSQPGVELPEVENGVEPAIERQAIERAMHSVSGNKARAARQLGISRTQLYIRLRKHGLEGAGA